MDQTTYDLLRPLVKPSAQKNTGESISDQEIVDRMMLPMIIECARCLEEEIVASPTEVDLSLVYGLGFPPFRGGALRYADSVGLQALCQTAEKYQGLGKLYHPSESMLKLAKSEKGFYQN